MANRAFVRALTRDQLRARNKTVLLQAGDQWEEMTMGDFYNSEKQINEDIEDIMKASIDFPDNDLKDKKWEELKEKVNLATPVKTAIDTTTDISAFAVSTNPVP